MPVFVGLALLVFAAWGIWILIRPEPSEDRRERQYAERQHKSYMDSQRRQEVGKHRRRASSVRSVKEAEKVMSRVHRRDRDGVADVVARSLLDEASAVATESPWTALELLDKAASVASDRSLRKTAYKRQQDLSDDGDIFGA